MKNTIMILWVAIIGLWAWEHVDPAQVVEALSGKVVIKP